ncbi:MAG: diguanylate cyclase [Lachnospiraceae bacterium]|nr:diguanylate cyclase [Lachnospiraceae bacterium]
MRNKNIAVLMTALDSPEQADILRGLEEYGKSHGCNVAVFLWFTGAFEKDKHNQGELNIARLPDLNLFDGVIVLANALHMENNRRQLEDLLQPVNCPVVTIGCKIYNSISVGTDNYMGMKRLVEHFVVDHKMSRIHFVKGIEGNKDAEARFQAYLDVLEEHGLPIVPERISQGDFYVTGGELAAREILSSDLPFPEAIVCANDTMAITICDILMKKGYRVPEDVAISGYDCSLEGQSHFPKITTVRSRFKDLGSEACRVLLDILAGKEVEKEILLPDEVVLDESCGCNNENIAEDVDKANGAGGADFFHRQLVHYMIMLEKNINEIKNFEDWLEAFKYFISKMNPTEFYFCANTNFVDDVFRVGTMVQEEMTAEEQLAYTSKTDVILAYKQGMFREKPSFETRCAFDEMFMDTEKTKLYIFSPMHYLERNFGYFVFVDSKFPIANILYVKWLINMGNALENIRRQTLLKNAMKRLDEMYVRDSLTDAYNRFGMERCFAELKRKGVMSSLTMQLSFMDIDKLKQINDEYGHEEGDRIISAAAGILQKCAGKFCVVRYGGDEFIVLGAVQNEQEVKDYWERVEEEIVCYNETTKKQAKICISYGYELFPIGNKTYLEDCINIVDKKMYDNKKGKRR